MCRKARVISATGVYHVVMRGVNRGNLFEEDEDKRYFLNRILRLKDEVKFELYSYCFMDNHVHLLIKEGRQNISKIIQRLCISYSQWFNRKYDRCGHLFQGRFKSKPVENVSYFATVFRYIIQNPVKAFVCRRAEEYSWSSVNEYRIESKIVNNNKVMKMFGYKKGEIGKLYDFLRIPEEAKCLDLDKPRWMSDRRAYQYIVEVSGVLSPFELQSLSLNRRSRVIKEILQHGRISCRQVSRITGIPLYFVRKQLLS